MPAIIDLDHPWSTVTVHDDVASATSDPDTDSDQLSVGRNNIIRTGVTFTGSVTAVTLRAWFYLGDTWFQGQLTEGDSALDPTLGTQAVDWLVGQYSRVHFQVESFTGTGSVTVIAGAANK